MCTPWAVPVQGKDLSTFTQCIGTKRTTCVLHSNQLYAPIICVVEHFQIDSADNTQIPGLAIAGSDWELKELPYITSLHQHGERNFNTAK